MNAEYIERKTSERLNNSGKFLEEIFRNKDVIECAHKYSDPNLISLSDSLLSQVINKGQFGYFSVNLLESCMDFAEAVGKDLNTDHATSVILLAKVYLDMALRVSVAGENNGL